jgi:hypothetical protein
VAKVAVQIFVDSSRARYRWKTLFAGARRCGDFFRFKRSIPFRSSHFWRFNLQVTGCSSYETHCKSAQLCLLSVY